MAETQPGEGVDPPPSSQPAARDTAPAARDTAPAARDTAPAARDTAPAARDTAPAAPTVADAPVGKVPRRRPDWRRALTLGGTILLIAGCAIYIVVRLGYDIGLTGLIIGLVAAILPVPVLVAAFLWLDRYEPEPIKYLVITFTWGAFVATAASSNVNQAAARAFDSWGLPDALVAVLVAPFIEELTKALGPILLLVFRRRQVSGITDGIVYCGLSAVGFAMVENILYIGGHGYAAGVHQYGPATGAQMVFLIFILRVLLTGFAHPLFTSMTGVGLGVAARSADRRVRWFAVLAGLLVAMMLHGTWNFLPSLAVATGQGLIVLYGYVAVMVPIFFGMVGLALWLRGWEGRLTERVLPHYVRAGWLSPPEVAALASLGRRHSARRWARRVAGEPGVKAMRDYQFSATRLALLRDGMLRGLDAKPADLERAVAEERRLLDAIAAYRQVFAGRDPQAPAAVWDGGRYHITFPDGVRRTLDAPGEPVVPVPVVLAPPPPPYPPAGGYAGGYPPPAGCAPPGGYVGGYPPPGGYAPPARYAPPAGYAPPGGHPGGYAPRAPSPAARDPDAPPQGYPPRPHRPSAGR